MSGSLGRGATPECSLFEDYVESCALVPTCNSARVAHEKLALTVCTNERGAIERVVPCGSAKSETESLCTVFVAGLRRADTPPPAAPLAQRGSAEKADGFVVALDRETGAVRWAVSTIDLPWIGIAVGTSGIALAGNMDATATVDGRAELPYSGQRRVAVAWLTVSGACRVARAFGSDVPSAERSSAPPERSRSPKAE